MLTFDVAFLSLIFWRSANRCSLASGTQLSRFHSQWAKPPVLMETLKSHASSARYFGHKRLKQMLNLPATTRPIHHFSQQVLIDINCSHLVRGRSLWRRAVCANRAWRADALDLPDRFKKSRFRAESPHSGNSVCVLVSILQCEFTCCWAEAKRVIIGGMQVIQSSINLPVQWWQMMGGFCLLAYTCQPKNKSWILARLIWLLISGNRKFKIESKLPPGKFAFESR